MAEPITIEERTGLAFATVIARKGVTAGQIGAVLGIAPPEGPRFAYSGSDALLGTGPQSWLALREGGENQFAQFLQEKLAGLASVSNQSSAYRVFRISGEGARTVLRRGAAVDFHPESFGPGQVAVTQIAHMGVVIWQFDATPSYFVACFRSYGESFLHWLEEAAGGPLNELVNRPRE